MQKKKGQVLQSDAAGFSFTLTQQQKDFLINRFYPADIVNKIPTTPAPSGKAAYQPPRGYSWVYTIISLSSGESLYVGVTQQNLTTRMQNHICAIKAGTKGASAKLSKYYDPTFTAQIDSKLLDITTETVLQINNFLIVAHAVPTKDRYTVESLLISGMSHLPCNTKDRPISLQLLDKAHNFTSNLGPEYQNLRPKKGAH